MSENHKPIAVVCGCFHRSNVANIVTVINSLVELGYDVFPSLSELKDSLPIILQDSSKSAALMELQGENAWKWLQRIANSDMVFFVNEKEGVEHLGDGSLIELGFALAYLKPVSFLHHPTATGVISVVTNYQVV